MDRVSEQRRLLIAAAAAAGLLPLVSTKGHAVEVNALAATNPPATPAGAIKNPIISPSDEASAWAALKDLLKQSGTWPNTFDVSLEAGVKEKLKDVARTEVGDLSTIGSITPKLTHNPRLVEPLLGEIASLLDRCLAYRREAAELEIKGVAAGVARIQAAALADVDQQLITATSSAKDAAAIVADNYPKAAHLFETVGNSSGDAYAVQMRTQALSSARIRDVEDTRIQLAVGRLQFVQDINRKLLGRYDVSGNSHNYAERYEQVRKLFESDILSAFRRAIAAADGLKSLFGYVDPKYDRPTVERPHLPNPDSLLVPDEPDFLGELVLWTRNAMREVARIGENEIEIVVEAYATIKPWSSQTDFDPEPLFDVDTRGSFVGLKYVRLRAIGASFIAGKDDLKAEEKANATFKLALLRDGDPAIGPREILVVPRVRAFNTQREPDFIEGGAIYNSDPRGLWSFRLAGIGLSIGHEPQTPNDHKIDSPGISRADWVKAIVLHMRVACVVDTSIQDSQRIAAYLIRS
jgi:hypothetical protein